MILKVKGLKIWFGKAPDATRAVDGIDFAIDENEVLGLVGESGSGKTMTALSIMGLLPPDSFIENGEILFDGKDLLKLNERSMLNIRAKKVSMIFQEPFTSLNPVLRIGEQVAEIFCIHEGLSKKVAAEKAEELLKRVRLKDSKRVFFSYPHQVSGGQRQRAMIAIALALKPKLLIADEPTTALDVTIQSEILNLLLDLKREFKMSILFITHDLGIINQIADRVLIMKEGKIVESGIKKDILHSPKHAYTKRLLDAIPKITEGIVKKSEGQSLISIKSLCKSFSIERTPWRIKAGEVKAVDDVNLEIKKGETLGLVGESASGKTTLGKLLLGLIDAGSGYILIEGKSLKDSLKNTPKEIRKMMQIVFQDPFGSLDPRFKMKDIVLEGPNIFGIPALKKEELLKEVLKKVNLEYGDRFKYPHQFSGGQRQRIAIARALAVSPKILVLDEPVSSLDVSIQADILNLLKNLQQDLGLTYLFISHDLRVVGFMSDRIAVMNKGRIVEIAPKDIIYKLPKDPYTKKLLSSIPSL